MIQRLHSVAMKGLLDSAGQYRQGEVHIQNSPHKCPTWIAVPGLMTTLCAYVNQNWEGRDLIHLSAFVLWRLNWVHPFANGNGRTARASAYLVLCAKYGALFPPKNTIIEQIQRDKEPYYKLLREVDAALAQTNDIDASLAPLEAYLTGLLKEQIRANLA
jgi:Fic family protein